MGRTTGPDEVASRAKKGDRGRGPRTTQGRTTLISKAFSKLLRHQAVNEGIPISSDGWVRLDHLLSWKGLTGRNGVEPPPTLEDVWGAVEDNEKKRFAVRLRGGTKRETKGIPVDLQDQPVGTLGELIDTNLAPDTKATADTETEDETATAISFYRNTSPSPSAAEFEIRAVQGHSIQSVASDTSLLTPITLENPSSIPSTCVHGTFYSAWKLILSSGGLKRMGRNHAHLAIGPTLAEIGITEQGDGDVSADGNNKVISGMRSDAQLLIYIDLKGCLEDVKARDLDMQWWRSQNGVILTEGVDVGTDNIETGIANAGDSSDKPMGISSAFVHQQQSPDIMEVGKTTTKAGNSSLKELGGRHKAARSKQEQAAGQSNKIIPMDYWKVVVDIKGGNGVIWRQGTGMVKELPQELLNKGNPKSFRGRGRGRGGRTAG